MTSDRPNSGPWRGPVRVPSGSRQGSVRVSGSRQGSVRVPCKSLKSLGVTLSRQGVRVIWNPLKSFNEFCVTVSLYTTYIRGGFAHAPPLKSIRGAGMSGQPRRLKVQRCIAGSSVERDLAARSANVEISLAGQHLANSRRPA